MPSNSSMPPPVALSMGNDMYVRTVGHEVVEKQENQVVVCVKTKKMEAVRDRDALHWSLSYINFGGQNGSSGFPLRVFCQRSLDWHIIHSG